MSAQEHQPARQVEFGKGSDDGLQITHNPMGDRIDRLNKEFATYKELAKPAIQFIDTAPEGQHSRFIRTHIGLGGEVLAQAQLEKSRHDLRAPNFLGLLTSNLA